jgi:quercetin dioxygenase-like cupin family protein
MTDATGASATQDLMSRLVSLLDALEPADRDAKIAHLLSVLEQESSPPQPDRESSIRTNEGGSPLMICDWASDSGLVGTSQNLTVDVLPGPTQVVKTKSATGRSLLSNGYLGVDIIHVPAGEGFAPHTHPGDHLLFVLGGYGTIAVGGTILRTAPGQAYMIEGAVPHAVGAITDHVLLAVGAPHRPLDSRERQTLIAYSSLLTPLGSIKCDICNIAARSGDELAAMGCPHSPHKFA